MPGLILYMYGLTSKACIRYAYLGIVSISSKVCFVYVEKVLKSLEKDKKIEQNSSSLLKQRLFFRLYKNRGLQEQR